MLVVGAEKMSGPDKDRTFSALASARDVTAAHPDESPTVFMDLYASFARERMRVHGLTVRQIAAVAAKNSWHGSMNPRAQYQTARTIEEVLESPVVAAPLTRFMCSPISDGAAAVVLDCKASGPVVRATAMTGPGHVSDYAAIRAAGQRAFELAGIGAEAVDVVEVHDASSVAEIAAYEGLGLCGVGEEVPGLSQGQRRSAASSP